MNSFGYKTLTCHIGLLLLLLLKVANNGVECLHLTGTFSNREFFKFLAKFGFQEVDKKSIESSQGFLYGRVSAAAGYEHVDYDMYLVVVDSQYFIQYYAARDHNESPNKCVTMFELIDEKAWDRFCSVYGQEDFLRRVPCPAGDVCLEEQFSKDNVLKGQQFTFHIVDTNQPRFWYLSLVACHRPRSNQDSCHWSYNSSIELMVDYDIWLVNGDPASKHLNPFEHQFSFEMHDVWEIYLTFFVLNISLLTLVSWVFRLQKHLLIWLMTAILASEVCGMLFNLLHISVFAVDGRGVPALTIVGNLVDTCAQSLVMLEILYIGKGWTITTGTLTRKPLLYSVWAVYTSIYLVLFAFSTVQADPVLDRDEWQTVPGYCILVFRIILMLYFLYELQRTISLEESAHKRSFYTRIGAAFLVWFIYLPVAALIAPKISALWRFKTLLCIQSGADLALLIILVHLFWPRESVQYFNIPASTSSSTTQELSTARLVGSDDDSSEDELYMRQTQLLMSNSTPVPQYSNGGTTLNKSRQSNGLVLEDESTC